MAKIIIADDHTLLREGLSSLLDSIDDLSVVGQASNGREALSLIEDHGPDLVILNLTLPELGGLGAITRMSQNHSSPSILVLTDKHAQIPIRETLDAGAQGCLSQSANKQELEFAIRSILKGLVYVSPMVASHLIKDESSTLRPIDCLSSREKEVFQLLAEGLPNRKIAKFLHISPRTIDSHRRNILKKLGLKNNSELVQLAIRMGMIA
jgi:DNA-binding NarL/FixJ family response regulator